MQKLFIDSNNIDIIVRTYLRVEPSQFELREACYSNKRQEQEPGSLGFQFFGLSL